MNHSRFEVGEVLTDRYRLNGFLGSGGMASVYRATDMHLGRTVAVKIFTTGVSDAENEARRASEASLLASLHHPALVTLFDAHLQPPGPPYLVMEYVAGGTLQDLLDKGPLTHEDAASLCSDTAGALRAVHEMGIVHRDVKPGNILLRTPDSGRGRLGATLTDFGVAHLTDAARLTSPGIAIGTAIYMAPEQVRGATPAPASDIYSLGLVLLEALTGQRAFGGLAPMETLAARTTTPPTIPAPLPYGWRSLLTSMTALTPEHRPTAAEVLDRSATLHDTTRALAATRPVTTRTAVMAEGPTVSREQTAAPAPADRLTDAVAYAHHSGRHRTRRPLLAALAAATVAASIAITVMVTGNMDPADPAPRPVQVADPPPAMQPLTTGDASTQPSTAVLAPQEPATDAGTSPDADPEDDSGILIGSERQTPGGLESAGGDESRSTNGNNGNGNNGNGNGKNGNGNIGNGNGANGNNGNGNGGNGNGPKTR